MKKEDVKKLSESIEEGASIPSIPVLDKRKSREEILMEADEYIPPKINQNKADQIMGSMKIEIPKCYSTPVNGRIYVIDLPGNEMRTDGGIILPMKMKENKAGSMKDIRRYFVVAFDKYGIPPEICEQLKIGIEVNPCLPQEAEEWTLPVVVDWHTSNVFSVIHYTELAGISNIDPEEVE